MYPVFLHGHQIHDGAELFEAGKGGQKGKHAGIASAARGLANVQGVEVAQDAATARR